MPFFLAYKRTENQPTKENQGYHNGAGKTDHHMSLPRRASTPMTQGRSKLTASR
ncbi:hypothetical protein YC2023_039512 [Brassica napus]